VSDDQQRAAERVPLEKPIEVTLNDVGGRIIEISLIGCKVEHTGRLNMGSTVNMDFLWQHRKIRLKAKVTRTEMRPIAGKPGYLSALQLAATLEESPTPLRRVIAGLLDQPFDEPDEPEPEPVKERIPDRPAPRPTSSPGSRPSPQPVASRPPASSPIKPKPSAPIGRPSTQPVSRQTPAVAQPIKPKPSITVPAPPALPISKPAPAVPPVGPAPPAPAVKPVTPQAAPVVVDEEIEEISASAEIRDDEKAEEIEELGSAEEISETPPDFLECMLVGGKWIKRHVRDPRQPREGFTMLAPEDESDIDQYCRSYEVADPDTRRMIRVSFDLAIARAKG